MGEGRHYDTYEKLGAHVVTHEGVAGARSDLLGLLRESIVAAVRRHVTVRPDQIQMSVHRGATVSTLAIEIEIPA